MSLPQLHENALNELMVKATQRAASALAEILEQPVYFQLEQARFATVETLNLYLEDKIPPPCASVKMNFTGDLPGTAYFILPGEHLEQIVASATQKERSLSGTADVERTILTEIGNVILNATVGTICNQLGTRVQYHLPVSTISHSWERSILETDDERQQPSQRWLQFISKLNVWDFKETACILVLLDYSNASNSEP